MRYKRCKPQSIQVRYFKYTSRCASFKRIINDRHDEDQRLLSHFIRNTRLRDCTCHQGIQKLFDEKSIDFDLQEKNLGEWSALSFQI